MATGVEELLDMLFEMLDEAKSMPLSSDKCILERDKALDLLDEIRAQVPMELAEAKKLIAARTEYIASAKREGELIRKQAEEKARQMVSEDELLAQTKQKANELMRTAEERSRDLRKAANDYCEDALRRTEEAVAEAYDERSRSRGPGSAPWQESAPRLAASPTTWRRNKTKHQTESPPAELPPAGFEMIDKPSCRRLRREE